jgi:putative FmdB family regulatory protein
MPIYEYVCLHCGAEFEKLLRRADSKDEVKCPKCGGAVEEKVSACASFTKAGESWAVSSGGACGPTGG